MQVNIIGLMTVTREFVKQMEERKCDVGHIINLNRCFVVYVSHTSPAVGVAMRSSINDNNNKHAIFIAVL